MLKPLHSNHLQLFKVWGGGVFWWLYPIGYFFFVFGIFLDTFVVFGIFLDPFLFLESFFPAFCLFNPKNSLGDFEHSFIPALITRKTFNPGQNVYYSFSSLLIDTLVLKMNSPFKTYSLHSMICPSFSALYSSINHGKEYHPIQALDALEIGGSTALGPALAVSIGLARFVGLLF